MVLLQWQHDFREGTFSAFWRLLVVIFVDFWCFFCTTNSCANTHQKNVFLCYPPRKWHVLKTALLGPEPLRGASYRRKVCFYYSGSTIFMNRPKRVQNHFWRFFDIFVPSPGRPRAPKGPPKTTKNTKMPLRNSEADFLDIFAFFPKDFSRFPFMIW